MEPVRDIRPAVRLFAPAPAAGPHLATWIDRVWHVRLLPRLPMWALWEVASLQGKAHALPTLLVLDSTSVVAFEPDGRIEIEGVAPTGGSILLDRLALPGGWDEPEEMRARRAALEAREIDDVPFDPCPWSGGHAAGPRDVERLAGVGPDGAPKGLEVCEACGERAGVCVRPGAEGRPALVPVRCRCFRPSRCARCEEPFHERRIGSAWYDEAAAEVRYVPALLALRHRCPGA